MQYAVSLEWDSLLLAQTAWYLRHSHMNKIIYASTTTNVCWGTRTVRIICFSVSLCSHTHCLKCAHSYPIYSTNIAAWQSYYYSLRQSLLLLVAVAGQDKVRIPLGQITVAVTMVYLTVLDLWLLVAMGTLVIRHNLLLTWTAGMQ